MGAHKLFFGGRGDWSQVSEIAFKNLVEDHIGTRPVQLLLKHNNRSITRG